MNNVNKNDPKQSLPAKGKRASPDTLVKGGNVELTEDELKNVSGGGESADHKSRAD